MNRSHRRWARGATMSLVALATALGMATGAAATTVPLLGAAGDSAPALGQSLLGQSLLGQSLLGQSLLGQPASGQPASGQSVLGQSLLGRPASQQPMSGLSRLSQPAPEGQPISAQSPCVPAPSGQIQQGQPPAPADGSVGTPDDACATGTPGQTMPDGTTMYPANPADQNLTGPTTNWYAYQQYSPICLLRGINCASWGFEHLPAGGPNGEGALRFEGSSLGVAPCIPEASIGVWNSPLFRYNGNANNWKIQYDYLSTFLVGGDGHAGLVWQIQDADGRIVATAAQPEIPWEFNKWVHREASFDGSKLVPGEDYRMVAKATVLHAETAATLGHIDMTNIKMTTGPELGTPPVVTCKPPASTDMQPGQGLDLCPTTTQIGTGIRPLTKAVNEQISQGSLKPVFDKTSGVFAVTNMVTGDMLVFVIPREYIPSLDVRDLMLQLENGTLGGTTDGAVSFVVRAPQVVSDLSAPPGAVPTVGTTVNGQLTNLRIVLTDPEKLLRLDPDWDVHNLQYVLQTMVGPLNTPAPDTQLGGTVWSDTDRDGIMEPGEMSVPGAKVTLTDQLGYVTRTTTTGPDGRYLFTELDPTSDTNWYFVTVDPASLAQGATFTTQYAPDTPHASQSSVDPDTGKTMKITLARGEQDLTWNAGIREGTPQPGPSAITVGTPTINGQPVTAGQPLPTTGTVQLDFPVTNTGTLPVGDVQGSSPVGPVRCTGLMRGGLILAPGQQAICTLTFQPQAGSQQVTITVTGKDSAGNPVTGTLTTSYTGTPSGDATREPLPASAQGLLGQLAGTVK